MDGCTLLKHLMLSSMSNLQRIFKPVFQCFSWECFWHFRSAMFPTVSPPTCGNHGTISGITKNPQSQDTKWQDYDKSSSAFKKCLHVSPLFCSMGTVRYSWPFSEKPVPISLENDSLIDKTGGNWAASTLWLKCSAMLRTITAPGGGFFTSSTELSPRKFIFQRWCQWHVWINHFYTSFFPFELCLEIFTEIKTMSPLNFHL